jgi:hypothetical protein
MLIISSSVSAESNEFISITYVAGLKKVWSVAVERVRCDPQSDEEDDDEDDMYGYVDMYAAPRSV